MPLNDQDRARRDATRSLIHNAFPPQGNENPAYMGSQSEVPTPRPDPRGLSGEYKEIAPKADALERYQNQ